MYIHNKDHAHIRIITNTPSLHISIFLFNKRQTLRINQRIKLNKYYKGRKPKNYIASNTVKIRELMKKVREREAAAAASKEGNDKNQPLKAVNKFEHVESKIKDLMIVRP